MKRSSRVRRPPPGDDRFGSEPPPRTAVSGALFRRPLGTEDVTELQQTAGNRAATLAVQRSRLPAVQRDGPVTWNVPATSKNRPTHGLDVRSVLRTELPGLLGGMTEAQLAHWQQVVDFYAVDRHLQREIRALDEEFRVRAGPLFASSGEYQDRLKRLQRARPKQPPGGTTITVDPQHLLADDVRAEPEWDVKAETAFRQWAVAQLAKDPPTFDIYPVHDDEIVSRRTWGGSYTTKGLITLADLRYRFDAQHRAMVTDREDWRKLRQALREAQTAYYEATQVHRERSAINARNRGVFGIDIIRNLIEAVGSGDQDYPAISQWEEPKALLARAHDRMRSGQFELSVPVIAMAEISTAKAANRIYAYDNRVESGARFWVTWLGRVKTVGSIAASVAAGPLGITGSALVAGGYTLVQEGGQNAMAYALGQRTDLGLVSAVKQAGVATAAGLLGGALQTRFQAAMAARVATITGTAGGAVRDATVSAAAAMTSSVYTTAAESVLNDVVLGVAMPKTATEFADLIVDKALQAGMMDVALRGPSARVARDYQAWRAGKIAPVVPSSGRIADPAGQPKPGAPAAAKDMPEHIARRLLGESGSWQRLQGELQAGTGLGHGLVPAERQALLDRFNATREQLARDVAGMFDGSVVAADTPVGRQIEVVFAGAEATKNSAEATAYLDLKSPGWRAQTEVAVRAASTDRAAPGARLMRALEQTSPRARLIADRFAPLYQRFGTYGPMEKLRAVVQVMNDYLRPYGVPDMYPMITRSTNDGQFHWKGWQLEVNMMLVAARNPTPEQFAHLVQVVVHEGHHALDAFRATRVNPARARGRVADEVYEAALAADLKTRPAESLDSKSLAYAAGERFSYSVWGPGRQHRKDVLDRLDASEAALEAAIGDVRSNRGEARNSAMRNDAARQYWAAKSGRERAHDDYMSLPEELGPWGIGQQTQAAMRERLALDREIGAVRAQVDQTFRRLVRTEDAYVTAALEATAGLAGAERAFERAKALYERTVAQLERLRERRAALLAPAAP